MRSRYCREGLHIMVEDISRRLAAQAQRLKALLQAALDAEALQALAHRFARLRATSLASGAARSGRSGALPGWWLSGRAGQADFVAPMQQR